jgi:hypothetical protein
MPILEDREIALKLISLLEAHNLKQDEKEKKKATRKKATKTVESTPIEDPIKSDINKMLEKPKKRRKPKEEDDEYGEIDFKLENATPNPEPQPQPQQQTFLEQEPQPIKQTITEKPVKERPTQAKLFKDDLLMKIDPNERVKAIESAKNTILSQTAQPIKEEQAKTNINNFLTRYSKNKKY